MGESGLPTLLQKEQRKSVKSDVPKVLFPDIGKITNRRSEQIFFKIGVFKNLQNSKENTCARVSFLIKLQALSP